MKYLVIDTTIPALVKAAQKLSRLPLALAQPDKYKTMTCKRLYPIYRNATEGLGAMAFDEARKFPLNTHNEDGTVNQEGVKVITAFINLRYPNITNAQKKTVRDWVLNNQEATMSQLLNENGALGLPALPQGVQIWTQQEFTDNANFEQIETHDEDSEE